MKSDETSTPLNLSQAREDWMPELLRLQAASENQTLGIRASLQVLEAMWSEGGA